MPATLVRVLAIACLAGMAIVTALAMIDGRSGTELTIYVVATCLLGAFTIYNLRRFDRDE
ncbi:hypothetical protein [Nocardia sp. CNY236]|uniref:hypothetical protein n=1 Tax=Nocardia sp. CNY236 TaxID=1169152 RepID=UPI0004199068|nr:hypothetical protein [Nocardia sp. CNY236]